MTKYHKEQYEVGDYVKVSMPLTCDICKVTKVDNFETHTYPYYLEPIQFKGSLFNVDHSEIAYGITEEEVFLMLMSAE